MFTKNWYRALYATMTGATVKYVNVNGEEKTVLPSSYFFEMWAQGTNAQRPTMYYIQKALSSVGGVILGTGTTPPTIDDYSLSGDIVTGFTYNSTVSATADDDVVTLTATYAIINGEDKEITIGEIALMCCLGSTKSGETYSGIIERTVLDSPVTIPAGGIGKIEYSIKMIVPEE